MDALIKNIAFHIQMKIIVLCFAQIIVLVIGLNVLIT